MNLSSDDAAADAIQQGIRRLLQGGSGPHLPAGTSQPAAAATAVAGNVAAAPVSSGGKSFGLAASSALVTRSFSGVVPSALRLLRVVFLPISRRQWGEPTVPLCLRHLGRRARVIPLQGSQGQMPPLFIRVNWAAFE